MHMQIHICIQTYIVCAVLFGRGYIFVCLYMSAREYVHIHIYTRKYTCGSGTRCGGDSIDVVVIAPPMTATTVYAYTYIYVYVSTHTCI